MKRIYNILFIIAAFTIAGGCKNYLDVQPQGKVIPKTDEEFAALIHTRINNIEGGDDMFVIGNFESIMLNESFTDNLDANVRIGNLAAYAGDKINTKQYNYKSYFEIIRDCNIVLENKENISTDLAHEICAAAYALKGICYYNLMRDYCPAYDPAAADNQLGMPLIEKFDMEEMPSRASLKATAEYTIELLKKAASYKISTRKFLIDEGAVNAYLAKTYFWTQDWDNCIELCNSLMNVKEYQLANTQQYEQMIQSKNGWGQEIIVRSHINNNADIDWYYTSYIKDFKTRPVNATLVKLFAEDKENDVRYAVSFDRKRFNTKNLSGKVRGSEIVLMLAECYYHKGDNTKALEQLNYLRRNRIMGVEDMTVDNLPLPDKTQKIIVDCTGRPVTPLLQAIFNERRKELYAEGDRWFELKRNGCPELWIINNGLKYVTHKYLYTAPIYKGDTDLNPNIIQNEGYIE